MESNVPTPAAEAPVVLAEAFSPGQGPGDPSVGKFKLRADSRRYITYHTDADATLTLRLPEIEGLIVAEVPMLMIDRLLNQEERDSRSIQARFWKAAQEYLNSLGLADEFTRAAGAIVAVETWTERDN
jgi:hypothetical protein